MKTVITTSLKSEVAPRKTQLVTLSQVSRTPRLLILALLILAVAAVLWACFTPIARVVRGEGRVIPAAHSQVIQHLEGGIVSEILVREGEPVKKNQFLLRLRDVQASAAKMEDENKLEYLQARVARLSAEANGKPIATLPSSDEKSAAVRSEIAAYEARQMQQSRELAVMDEALGQRRNEIQEAQTKAANLRDELKLAQEQLDVVSHLRGQNAASTLEMIDAQSRVQRLKSSLTETQTLLLRLRGATAEASARMTEFQARRRADARSELAAAQLELERTQQDLRTQSDRLMRTEIRSPVDGVVNHVYVNTVGGVVRPGEPLMELTPAAESVLVEGKFRPSDRGELRPGLKARIGFSAYDYASRGSLTGVVEEVSADTIADERGERNYRVSVRIPHEEQQRTGKPIIPGMTATIDVVVGSRTVMEYLISPVYRMVDSAFREAR
ncbi:HlyD family type I secretion periplasmic adaptor subunit [Herbaspirillum rubrisubalbicans]|uniref:Membrane fusion protein (MFP) family protein n=1 Tax=Herbaspirillum rubrisubalbicans TaxID=80842 RepID=A0AAD0U650_9BURK|nr:HlyD family type I secretion periplasmic adaptor subunit [Herbaspirillum rubrisubalbicans]AYR23388.1 HlyD family type I secretion periplasmic adaptor subunit [Herbaspirillum rubrisubalbicans]